jgi:hypothetical protein
MADELRALGETVTDRHLILNLLHDLNKRFDHIKIFIKWSQSFPSIHTVCNDLELEEVELDHSAAQGQASAFYFAPSGGGCPLQQQLPPCPPQQELSCPQAAPPPPPPAPTPTTVAKARVWARGRGKARIMAPTTLVTTATTITGAPRCDPLSTIPKPALSRCGQGCILGSSSRRVHRSMPCLLHRRIMCSLWPLLHTLVGACTALAAGHGPCLVALDGRVGSTVISQLLQHHGIDSSGGHRLGRELRRLQPHHLECR